MSVKIEVDSTKLEEVKDQCLVIAFFEDMLKPTEDVQRFDRQIGGIISDSIKNKDFKAEEGEIRLLYLNKSLKYVALLGLGKENNFNLNKLMDSISGVSKRIRGYGLKSFSLYLESFKNKSYHEKLYLEKITQAIMLSLYQFLNFKTKDLDKVKAIETATLLVEKNILEESNKLVKEVLIYAEAVNKTRDLVNTPPNIANPIYIAEYARDIARKNSLECTILEEKEIEKLGMECFMAVARGSANKPRIVILEYNGEGKEAPIVLVGKGITFDTGGINVKPASYMTTMKDDKAGACGVIHILETCAKLKLKMNVIGIAALAENVVSDKSYRPDDVLKSYSGITVEITNTDAEGRLVLADALSYSLKYKPKAIIDIATLTGASIVALGYFASPFVSNDPKLADRLKSASEKSLEKIWQFPLWEEYQEILKSDIADIKHLHEGVDAGVIIGGIFLKNFIKDTPWAHLDIGNTVWAKSEKGCIVKGATGFSVLLLLNLLRDWK